jgi:hypothetical protein
MRQHDLVRSTPLRAVFILSGLALLLTILYSNCGGSGGSDFRIPTVRVTCAKSKSAPCDASTQGDTVYVGIQPRNAFTSCLSLMDQALSTFEFADSFTAWGQATLTGAATQASAEVSDFSTPLGAKILALDVLDTIACAFIDVNGNGRLDPGEPAAQDTLAMGIEMDYIETWTTR